ncbi:MAG: RidA family protein, partial [Candidatus Acidiferrum sp.]
MRQQFRNVCELRSIHAQPACKRVPQVVPFKILDARLRDGIVEPMPAVYVTSVDMFPAVNEVYRRYFPENPPARIFINVPA